MSDATTLPKRLPLPDVADICFLLVLQLILFLKPDFVFSDGSLGWHLITGNYILQNHTVPYADLVSYTFPGKYWVAYEWLSDVVMAALVKLGGLNLLAVAVGSAISLISFLLYRECRKRGCHYLIALTLVVLGAIVSSIHWLARPHIFTFFGIYIFATSLEDFWQGSISSRRLLLTLALTMLVWTNCHPAFLFGLIMVGVYAFCALMQYFFASSIEEQGRARTKALTLTLAGVVSGAVTLVNPYFINLYFYIFHYLSTGQIIAATDEFSSPIFHGALQPDCLEVLILLFMVGLMITRKPISAPSFLLSLLFVHFSLSAVRNMPLFVIVILPVLGQLFSATAIGFSANTASSPMSRAAQALLNIFRDNNTTFTITESRCNMHILPWLAFATLCLASLSGGRLFGFEVINSTFDAQHKPTKTLDKFSELKLDPQHGFNLDNWGGYLAYEKNIPVFIDDRADFYGDAFYEEYGKVIQLLPGWEDVLKARHITWILVPNKSRLALQLGQNLYAKEGWRRAEQDNAASLFVLETPAK